MIESKQEVSKDLEKALQALKQAKQRVANETVFFCFILQTTYQAKKGSIMSL